MSQQLVTLLLGSNLGNPQKNIETALIEIENKVGEIIKKSEIIQTKPIEFVSNKIFCNIAVLLKTQFSPIKLLNLIKKIEVEMGRTEDSTIRKEYLDRIIDIDIVLYRGIAFHSTRLQIPHEKHLYSRKFSSELLLNIKKH